MTTVALNLLLAAAAIVTAGEPLRGPAALIEKPFGVLLIGEGGDRDWKTTIGEVKKRAGKKYPLEFAGGLADGKALQGGLDALQAQRVKNVVIVPLFVSSYGDVMDQLRYLLGIREKPSETFAGPRARASAAAPPRLRSRVPLVLTKALDDHPLFVELLAARAQALSRRPGEEAVILIGETPAVKPGDKERAAEKEWLQAAAALAEKVRQKGSFAAARAYALQSGATQKDRELSEGGLRALLKELRRSHKVIIVPLTMSGSRPRLARALDGLFVKYDGRAVLPDPRIPQWVEETAAPAAKLPDMRLFKDASRTGFSPIGLTKPPGFPPPGDKHD